MYLCEFLFALLRHAALTRPEELSCQVINIHAGQVDICCCILLFLQKMSNTGFLLTGPTSICICKFHILYLLMFLFQLINIQKQDFFRQYIFIRNTLLKLWISLKIIFRCKIVRNFHGPTCKPKPVPTDCSLWLMLNKT